MYYCLHMGCVLLILIHIAADIGSHHGESRSQDSKVKIFIFHLQNRTFYLFKSSFFCINSNEIYANNVNEKLSRLLNNKVLWLFVVGGDTENIIWYKQNKSVKVSIIHGCLQTVSIYLAKLRFMSNTKI